MRNNFKSCNVLFTNTIQDKAGSDGLPHLHEIVSQLFNPGPVRGIFLPLKSCDK